MHEFPAHLWFKSSRTVEHNQCVEVAMTPDAVGIRDTKNRCAGHFTVSPTTFAAFIADVKRGDLDLPCD